MTKDRAPAVAQHFVERFFPRYPVGTSQEVLAQAIAVEVCDHFPDADEATILKAMQIVKEFLVADDAFDNPDEA